MSFLVHLAFFAGWMGSKIAFPSSWVSSGIGAVWLVLFLSTTLYFAVFSWKRRASPLQGLGYGIVAAIHYPEFLWKLKPRLDLSWEEKKQLLALSPAITHVSRPSSLLCPFCKIEIEHILVALPGEGIGVRKRPVLCPPLSDSPRLLPVLCLLRAKKRTPPGVGRGSDLWPVHAHQKAPVC